VKVQNNVKLSNQLFTQQLKSLLRFSIFCLLIL